MTRALAAVATFLLLAPTAQAQQAPGANPQSGQGSWLLAWMLTGGAFLIYVIIISAKSRKIQKAAIEQSFQNAADMKELSRQQLAQQAETNRLLAELVARLGDRPA